MATYNLIIQNILKPNNNVFLPNYIDDGIDNMIRMIFIMLPTKEITIKNKFLFVKDSLENFLIKNNREDLFMNYFCKIQKIYNILNRFVYMYKYKRAKIVVNTDMCLNEININDKNVICLFHNNSKYLFHSNDLIKIINSSLTNSHMHFSEPKCVKNPYDNIPFKKSTLYNIYFFIRYKTNYYPELFFKFFNVEFNLTNFKNNNEYILREYSIKNFVDNSPSNVLVDEIKHMIEYYNDYCLSSHLSKRKIKIHEEFPKDKLIKIMKPYLFLYMKSQYSYLVHVKRETSYILKQKLLVFNKFNPQFGRKMYKIATRFTDDFKRVATGKITEFNDKHVKFNNVEKQNNEYLTDHLKYNEGIIVNERLLVRASFTFNFITNINDHYGYEDEEDEHGNNDDDDDNNDDNDNNDNNDNNGNDDVDSEVDINQSFLSQNYNDENADEHADEHVDDHSEIDSIS